MNEFYLAQRLAAAILDQPSRDTDDDMSVLARQFNRAVERATQSRTAGRAEGLRDAARVATERFSNDPPGAVAYAAGILIARAIRALASDPAPGGQVASWQCIARKSVGANDPQDCAWPFCGCDPAADKVIAAIQESGYEFVKAPAHPDPGEVERLKAQMAEQETLAHAYVSTQGVGMQILVDANARLAAEIERLRAIEAAARELRDGLKAGFIVCASCGLEETTSDIDGVAELDAALSKGPTP